MSSGKWTILVQSQISRYVKLLKKINTSFFNTKISNPIENLKEKIEKIIEFELLENKINEINKIKKMKIEKIREIIKKVLKELEIRE